MGRREGIRIERERGGEEGREEGIMEKMSLGEKWWRLVGIYINRDLEEKLEKLREWMKNREEGVRVLIEGDFNARERGRVGENREEGDEERKEGQGIRRLIGKEEKCVDLWRS